MPAVTGADRDSDSPRLLWILGVATALCYAVGYPLALVGGMGVGWVLVAVGGPLLIAFLIVVIRRIQS